MLRICVNGINIYNCCSKCITNYEGLKSCVTISPIIVLEYYLCFAKSNSSLYKCFYSLGLF